MCLRVSTWPGLANGQRLAERFYCSLIAEPALKEQAFGQFEGMTTVALLQNNPDAAEGIIHPGCRVLSARGESLQMLRSE